MNKLSEKISEVVFDWTKIIKKLETSSANQDDLKTSLKIREQYLLSLDVTNIELFHKSSEYYSVKFSYEGKSHIKQFRTDEL